MADALREYPPGTRVLVNPTSRDGDYAALDLLALVDSLRDQLRVVTEQSEASVSQGVHYARAVAEGRQDPEGEDAVAIRALVDSLRAELREAEERGARWMREACWLHVEEQAQAYARMLQGDAATALSGRAGEIRGLDPAAIVRAARERAR